VVAGVVARDTPANYRLAWWRSDVLRTFLGRLISRKLLADEAPGQAKPGGSDGEDSIESAGRHLEVGVVAYSPPMAAALSGATIDQLRHWRSSKTGPLLAPEISDRPIVLYSFRDLLAIRTFIRFRRVASLQKIRRAVGTLRDDLEEFEHLASYRLESDLAGNIQLIRRDEAVDLVRHPGQLQLLAVIGDVIEPFPIRPGVVVPHMLHPRAGLSVDPEIQGGIPVISGTRVPYDAVASLMREDVSADEVSAFYPTVTPEAARDALDFALYVDSYDPATRAA
jgi:uncharacterized protein (DUF433 family)/DNA-binding transcriptional MerR regulator